MGSNKTISDGYLTGSEEIEILTQFLYPGAIVSAALSLFGVLTFFAFKKNRKFPVALLACISIQNGLYSTYLAAKWAPNSAANYALVTDQQQSICYFSLWIDLWNYFSLVELNFLIAAVLYLTICLNKDIEYATNPRYLWSFFGFYWIIIIIAPLVIASEPSNEVNGACTAPSQYAILVPLGIMIFGQIAMVTRALTKAWRVISAASKVTASQKKSKDTRMLYMLVRFSLTILSQILNCMGYFVVTVSQTSPSLTLKSSGFEFAVVIIPVTTCIDASILILGNKPLMRWCFARCGGKNGANSTSDSASQEMATSKRSKTGSNTHESHLNGSVSLTAGNGTDDV